MAQLAIQGHATRGKEVIETLKMLGGKNIHNPWGVFKNRIYTINEKTNEIIDVSEIYYSNYNLFTLEEFLEKFPYKVGDKVQHRGATSCGSVFEVEKMRWEEDTVKYTLRLFGCNYKTSTLPAAYLQPYKEETMKETIKIDIPKGYEFAGVDDDKQQVVFEKIGCQYPKTYEECCNVIGCDSKMVLGTMPVRYNTLVKLEKLLICRDAYWKIAGEQMGLGKSWKPELNSKKHKFALSNVGGNISFEVYGEYNSILCFPTEEMRDAFNENFKELIEICKELL